jgi:hypothetical protein
MLILKRNIYLARDLTRWLPEATGENDSVFNNVKIKDIRGITRVIYSSEYMAVISVVIRPRQ